MNLCTIQYVPNLVVNEVYKVVLSFDIIIMHDFFFVLFFPCKLKGKFTQKIKIEKVHFKYPYDAL